MSLFVFYLTFRDRAFAVFRWSKVITAQQDPDHVIIREIYDSVVKPGLWPNILERVADSIGARGAFMLDIHTVSSERRVVPKHFTSNYDADAVGQYFRDHNQRELADQDVLTSIVGRGDDIDLVPDTVLQRQEGSMNDVWRTIDRRLDWRAAAILTKDCHDRGRLAFQFTGDANRTKEWHLRRAAIFLPHIAKAMDLGRSISEAQQEKRQLSETLESLLVGVAIMDARGRMTFCNTEFRRHLDAAGSIRLDRHGGLLISFGSEVARIDHLYGSLGSHGRFGGRPRKEAVILNATGAQHLIVEVMPLCSAPQLDHSDSGGHIIYSIDMTRAFAIDRARMTRLFGLTPAEADVMAHLAEGLTSEQIADRRDTSVMTARTQLKSIYSKLGVSGRIQAVRVAANSSNAFILSEKDRDRTAADR
ncbi:helix-turn-helix transcriptional regulator [Aurantimonas sp. NFXS3]|uniref:helix-turn-helix transcriptional regulator n=1 Tax=Aurantimonas sp. NFXS3 TaxID=2818434 RepID=UPI003B8B9DA1